MPKDADSITIRRATEADAGALAAFARRTFDETFGADNDPAHLAVYLDQAYGEVLQAAEIRDPAMVTLLGEAEGRLAAYMQLRRGAPSTCHAGPEPLEIKRFYVDAPWHGRGIARRMMAEAIAEARRQGARTVWLPVWERNPRAIRFYEKQGFRVVGAQEFLVGEDRQNDLVMARPVDEG